MTTTDKHTGFAIAIAWPQTWCKQAGAWYDSILSLFGISKHHYFRVGHAALVLVDDSAGRCRYFDFGRYHTPFQHGRVRSEKTDDGLKMKTIAKISADKNQILNFDEILTELQGNAECHGEGEIHASYGRIIYNKALAKAKEMQQQSPVRYGPFRYGGSNCSRFVNSVIRAGKPALKAALKLNFLVPFTPTPLNNVNAFRNKTVLPEKLPVMFIPAPLTDKSKLKDVLSEPSRPATLPRNAKWLSGEGAGSWFSISNAGRGLWEITRFSPDGKTECTGIFVNHTDQQFKPDKSFTLSYLSHCRKVVFIQNNTVFEFMRKYKKEKPRQNKVQFFVRNEKHCD